MNSELFKRMIEKQNEWRNQFYADKKTRQLIRTICNRKYKSKGNQELEEIHKSLLEMGFLEDVTLVEREYGNLCDSRITIKHSNSDEQDSILEHHAI